MQVTTQTGILEPNRFTLRADLHGITPTAATEIRRRIDRQVSAAGWRSSRYHTYHGNDFDNPCPGQLKGNLREMYTTILTYGRLGVLLVAASVVVTVSCGGGAVLSSSESLASALPTKPTSLPLQPDAPAVGGDVQAPLQDLARLKTTEAQVMEMTDACRNASEIVAGSECTTAIQVNTENAPPCAAKDLCTTAAEVGAPAGTAGGAPATASSEPEAGAAGSTPQTNEISLSAATSQQQVRYIIAITDERPGSPLCSDAPGGLCFVLPADDEAAADIVNNARFAQSTLPEPDGRESPDAEPPTSPSESPETTTGQEQEVPPTPESPLTTEPGSVPPSEPESPPVDQLPPVSPPPPSPSSGTGGGGETNVPPPTPTGT